MKPTLPNTVIQQSWKEYPDFADYLVELGFRRVVLGSVSAKFKANSKPVSGTRKLGSLL